MTRQAEITSIGKQESCDADEMRTIADRINYLIETTGITHIELAKRLGVSRGAVSNWARGKAISGENIARVAEVFGVTMDWLKLGKGKMPEFESLSVNPLETLRVNTYSPEGNKSFIRQRATPILGTVAAGVWLEIETMAPYDQPKELLPIVYQSEYPDEAVFGLYVKGTSLNRIAPEGSILICLDLANVGGGYTDGDLVVVERRMRQGGLREVTAKRVRHRNGTTVLMPESDDPQWQRAVTLDPETGGDDTTEVSVIARVLGVYIKP